MTNPNPNHSANNYEKDLEDQSKDSYARQYTGQPVFKQGTAIDSSQQGNTSVANFKSGVRSLFTNPKSWSRKKQFIVGAFMAVVLIAIIAGAAAGAAAHKNSSNSAHCDLNPCGFGCPDYETGDCNPFSDDGS